MARATRDLKPTIAPALFEAWQKMRRKGDADELTIVLGKSRPVIDKALKYGYVKDDLVVDGITKFYSDRLKSETAEGAEMLKKIG